jgi:hypothetical protein
MSRPNWAMLDSRERLCSSARTPGHAVPTRAYQPRHNASTTATALPSPKPKAHQQRAFNPYRLDKPHSISALRWPSEENVLLDVAEAEPLVDAVSERAGLQVAEPRARVDAVAQSA